ncbi:hypothetical protein MLD38_003523 [Melastoma candidum]|uniref:Uncharacterized protein n=1 Tax=Melastoma candidum TaxID=119954 RepID=A0ACB9S3I8_9MYRT|nr:hypothetical protein MLD38_003523 [Melastoma candidum]
MAKQLLLFSFLVLAISLLRATTFAQPAAAPLPPALPATAPSPPVVPAAAPSPPATPTVGVTPSGPDNIVKILEKARQFTVLVKLLRTTSVGDQITSQLKKSHSGLTIFAPADDAFASLKAGTLNSMSPEQQIELLQFHVVPTFLSMSQFQTVSNPLRTQAGGSGKFEFPMNLATFGNSVNISTGLTNATVSNTIYSDNQLAVYQVDKVLLPMKIFGPQPPAPAPSPVKKPKKKPAAALSPSAESVPASTSNPADAAADAADTTSSSGAGRFGIRGVVAVGAAFMGTLSLL